MRISSKRGSSKASMSSASRRKMHSMLVLTILIRSRLIPRSTITSNRTVHRSKMCSNANTCTLHKGGVIPWATTHQSITCYLHSSFISYIRLASLARTTEWEYTQVTHASRMVGIIPHYTQANVATKHAWMLLHVLMSTTLEWGHGVLGMLI